MAMMPIKKICKSNNMRINIGVNGFGRIGRLVFRASLNNKFTNVVAINDIIDIDYLVYMLKYDSTHGKFSTNLKIDGNYLIIDEQRIRVSSEKKIENLKWGEVQADYIVESTGLFLRYPHALNYKPLCRNSSTQMHLKL